MDNYYGPEPNISIISQTNDHLECIISGVNVAYVNGLRRSILSDVPTLAIDLVKISVNDTPLSDERIAHRLGLIPLWSAEHVDSMSYAIDCDCANKQGYCTKCGLTCSLDITNNDMEENMTIYDRDLRFISKDSDTSNTVVPLCMHDPNMFMPIPIARLAPGQRLKFDCVIRKGNGKLHAKFAPVSACFHRPCVRIELANSLFTSENIAHINGICPRKLFIIDAAAEKVTIDPNAEIACIECGECEKIRVDGTENGEKFIKIIQQEDKFYLSLDSVGQLPIIKLLVAGIDHMTKTIAKIQEQFERL